MYIHKQNIKLVTERKFVFFRTERLLRKYKRINIRLLKL